MAGSCWTRPRVTPIGHYSDETIERLLAADRLITAERAALAVAGD
jgi:hypothetical protein